MWRNRILDELLLHDSVERDVDLQAQIDAVRRAWIIRRALFSAVAVVVLLGFSGTTSSLLVWQVGLVVGLSLSEAEIYVARRAISTRSFERRVVPFRVAFIVAIGVALPAVIGPSWIVAVLLLAAVTASAALLETRARMIVLGAGSLCYLGGTVLLESGLIDPLEPGGPSGGVSLPWAVVFALVLLPGVVGFVSTRSRRAERARLDLQRTVNELQDAQARIERSQADAQELSERLAADVEYKTEELGRRNRALSIVNAISFAWSEPFEDDAALRRASRLVARLLGVDAVEVRELSGHEHDATALLVGPTAGSEELPRIGHEVVDAALASSERVTQSVESDPGAVLPYVIVPMVTQGTVHGSLTLIGEACRDWGEQELHLLTLIGREMGAALESARLYRQALALADRENLLTEASALLGDGAPLHQQLDSLLSQIGDRLQLALASIVSVETAARGPELSRWAPEESEPFSAEELEAVSALIPLPLDATATPLLRAAAHLGGTSLLGRLGDVVIAPIVTTTPEAPTAGGHEHEESEGAAEGPVRASSAVLLLAAPAEHGWRPTDVDVVARLAASIGRRLEGEQLIQLQQRRVDELAALAEIGRVIQTGADVDRLYGDFAVALHRLVPYQRAYIARAAAGSLSEVIVFSGAGRVRATADVRDDDVNHAWFNSREVVAWVRGADTIPAWIDPAAAAGLMFPMRPKGEALGAVVIESDEAQPFSVRLAERAVEQLALVLDSAELYRQATERASRIEAQRNLAKIVASAADLGGAFDAFAEEIRWLMPFERALMLTVDEIRGTAEQVAVYPPVRDAEFIAAPLEGSVLSYVLTEEGPVALSRSDEALAGLSWSLIGDDAVEVAIVPIRDGPTTNAFFALVHSGVADYGRFDLRALEEIGGLLAVTLERLRLYERAEHAANHDLLTGLPNYRFLQERLATLRTEFDGDRRSAVLMIDMDGLKLYNDTLGHEAGDRAIQRVAQELRSTVRGEDLVARTGGDEFVVVMEDVSEDDAMIIIERMHDSLRDIHREFGDAPVPVRISVGLAFAPDDGTGASELLEAADRAMYAAKFSGGDRTRAAGGEDGGNTPRTLRRRGNRVMELLIRTAVDGASAPERLAVALAQRYIVAVAIGRGLPVDTADPLRMLVAAEAAHHLEAPEEYRDQETALLLLDGLRSQFEQQVDLADLKLNDLLPAAVRLAWEQIPAPDGPGLNAEQALAVVVNDPAYDLGPEVVELLTQSARTAEFERRRSRRDAA